MKRSTFDSSTLFQIWVGLIGSNLILAIIASNYFKVDLYDMRTFLFNDGFDSQTNTKSSSIFMGHYFGDFQNSALWVRESAPYASTFRATIGLPPLGIYIWRLFSFEPRQFALLFYMAVSLGTFLTAAFLYSRKSKNSNSNEILIVACLFSTPLLIALDRGNSILLSFSLFSLGLYFLFNHSKNLLVVLFLAAAVSLKIYLIVPVISLLVIRKYRKTILKFLLITFGLNGLLAFSLNSNPIAAVQNILQNSGDQLGGSNYETFYGGIGFIQFFMNTSRIWCSDMNACGSIIVDYFIAVPIVWLIYTAYVLKFKKMNDELKIILLFSSIQVVPAVAMPYTAIWQSIALVIYFSIVDEINCSKLIKIGLGISMILPTLLLPFNVEANPVLSWRAVCLFSIASFYVFFHLTLREKSSIDEKEIL